MMDDTRLARLTRELGDPEIAGLLVGARRQVVRAVPQHVAHRHMTAVLTAVGAIGVAGASSASAATVSAATASGAGASGAVAASSAATALTGLKLAAAAAAVVGVAVAGGLAVTGNLPDSVQEVVADAAERIGIGLPSPDRAGPGGAPGQGEEVDFDQEEPADRGPDRTAPDGTPRERTQPDEARDDPPRREDVPRGGEPTEQPPAAPEGKGGDSAPGKGTPGTGEPGEPDGSDDATDLEPETPVPPPGKSADSQGEPPDDRGGKHTPLDEAGKGRASDAQNRRLAGDEPVQEPQPDVDASADAETSDD